MPAARLGPPARPTVVSVLRVRGYALGHRKNAQEPDLLGEAARPMIHMDCGFTTTHDLKITMDG
eukprot:11207015-Lingulodinium_polyedra.AAC.1